jgi:hypothetical protein
VWRPTATPRLETLRDTRMIANNRQGPRTRGSPVAARPKNPLLVHVCACYNFRQFTFQQHTTGRIRWK